MNRYGFMDFLADHGLVYKRSSENDISKFFQALSDLFEGIANDNEVKNKAPKKAA